MSTTYVTYEWAEPDPDIIAQQLIVVANELDDLAEPMALAGEITRLDIQENFNTQSDPSGAPWQPWADSYEPWALAHGAGRILHLEGALQGSINSPSAFVPTHEGLFLDTSGLPEYWAWHNFGAYERTTKSRGEDVFGTIGGSENPLPERPFVGTSPEARAKMDAVFALWFEGTISIVMGGRGSKLRGPGGRFMKMP